MKNLKFWILGIFLVLMSTVNAQEYLGKSQNDLILEFDPPYEFNNHLYGDEFYTMTAMKDDSTTYVFYMGSDSSNWRSCMAYVVINKLETNELQEGKIYNFGIQEIEIRYEGHNYEDNDYIVKTVISKAAKQWQGLK